MERDGIIHNYEQQLCVHQALSVWTESETKIFVADLFNILSLIFATAGILQKQTIKISF